MLNNISPCDLIQEYLKDSPWRVFVACSLMNKTAGLTMRPIMWKLFERWPSAKCLVKSAKFNYWATRDEIKELVKPLGFYNQRAKRLIKMARVYENGLWTRPEDLPGVGQYGADSYRIFCLNETVQIDDLKDKELRRYIHWFKTGEYIPQDKSV